MLQQPDKKPILVLDLDNTLLHTGDDDIPVARPGLTLFLTRVRRKYELFVFTFGTRDYALHVCNVLQISLLFVHPKNIFSRENAPYDERRGHHVKAFEVFLCNQCTARSIAVDDSPQVWAADTFEWEPGETRVGPSARQVVCIPQFVHDELNGDAGDTYLDRLGVLLVQIRTVKRILGQGATRYVQLRE